MKKMYIRITKNGELLLYFPHHQNHTKGTIVSLSANHEYYNESSLSSIHAEIWKHDDNEI